MSKHGKIDHYKAFILLFIFWLYSKLKYDKINALFIINKSVYVTLGVDLEGKKDVLDLWISENEGAKFWLAKLTEMKNQRLNDIFIACSDNLTGMSESKNQFILKQKINYA